MAPSLTRSAGRLAALVVIGVVLLGIGVIPMTRGWMIRLARMLLDADVAAIRAQVLAAGAWAPAVSAGLMILQAIVAPLPASPIAYANGLVFGVWWGGVLSWASALAAAALCFGLSRRFGRPLAERLVSARAVAWSDQFFRRFGIAAVLIGRLLPFVSFDVVSYGAGLTRISFTGFMIATAIGMIPGTFLYAWLGHLGGRSGAALLWTVAAVTALGLILVLVGPYVTKRLTNGVNVRPRASR
ncbi:MAG: TVP38/TMEM64 family protein [Candidatus Rokubacteria bacterium]|nr:TVP38/TMEM64 family protein [Candidatus Rokubacteria bacterium]